jgi:hypothetical protein
VWKCALLAPDTRERITEDVLKAIFRQGGWERNKLISSVSRIHLYLECNSMVFLEMSLNCVLLLLKFLKRSIYLLCWFDSIRETAKRLIGSLVFELSKLLWLSEVLTMAGWKWELCLYETIRNGKEWRNRQEETERGWNKWMLWEIEAPCNSHLRSFCCSQSVTFKSGQRFFKANRETALFDINFNWKFCNMPEAYISCFNGKWAYFRIVSSSSFSTEHVNRMLSLCFTSFVDIVPFSLVITDVSFACGFHIYCITVITICSPRVLLLLRSYRIFTMLSPNLILRSTVLWNPNPLLQILLPI